MQLANLPAWPRGLKRTWFPLANIQLPKLSKHDMLDLMAIERAAQIQRREEALQNSNTTGTWRELMWVNVADGTALASSASETSLITGINDQPAIPALFFTQVPKRTISFLMRGVMSATGTPNFTFNCYLATSAGAAGLTTKVATTGTFAITASTVTNVWWEARLDLTCRVQGLSSGNTTLAGSGYFFSPKGLATPFIQAMEPTSPDTTTWTVTIDGSVTQYFNPTAQWGTSSSSNSITLKQLLAYGEN